MQYMDLYPLISAFIGVVLAQVLKPVLYYLVHHQWRGELLHTHFQDPIYQTKMKEVLGHKWVECFGGAVLGILIALICRLPA